MLSSILSAKDTWFSFEDKQKEIVGYKDANGKVMITPQFKNYRVYQRKFDDILLVDSYYLLKAGRKFGEGKAYYTSEGMGACESEGYILFREGTYFDGLVGVFDKNANIAIPAEYNYLSNVHSNLLYGKRGAKSVKVDSEHRMFKGGTVYLLNTKNELLIKDFKPNVMLDYRSMKISKEPNTDKMRDNFLGINAKYYSFVNYKKEFNNWFLNTFLTHINKEKIASHLYNTIFYDNNNNRKDISKEKFLSRYYKHFTHTLKRINDTSTKWKIDNGSFYYTIGKHHDSEYIYDNCGDEIEEKYPLFDVTINHMVNGKEHQDIISFLRTKNGYKMVHNAMYNEVRIFW